jgi:hypothetical protein
MRCWQLGLVGTAYSHGLQLTCLSPLLLAADNKGGVDKLHQALRGAQRERGEPNVLLVQRAS